MCGWCRDKRSGSRVREESYPTLTAEQALWRERGATCRAEELQLGATAYAKAKIVGIVMLTVGTTHMLSLFPGMFLSYRVLLSQTI